MLVVFLHLDLQTEIMYFVCCCIPHGMYKIPATFCPVNSMMMLVSALYNPDMCMWYDKVQAHLSGDVHDAITLFIPGIH